MRPSKFAYAAGSLVFALVTPPVARLAVVAIALTLSLLAYWSQSEPTLVMGTVVQTKTEASVGNIMGITPLWPWANAEVAVLPPQLAAPEAPYPGDWVIGFGDVISLEDPRQDTTRTEDLDTGQTQYLALSQIGLFSVGQDLSHLGEVSLYDRIDASNPWVVTTIALAIAFFAQLAMRLAACGAVGYITALTSFAVLHLNARDGLLPIPDALFEPLILAGGVAGLVLTFKATLGDSWRLGERAGAVLAVLMITPLLFDLVDAPETLSSALPLIAGLIAVLFPVLVPLSLASAMLTIGLDQQPQMAVLFLIGLMVTRQVATLGKPKRKAAASAAFHPEVDETGAFDLNDLITSGKG